MTMVYMVDGVMAVLQLLVLTAVVLLSTAVTTTTLAQNTREKHNLVLGMYSEDSEGEEILRSTFYSIFERGNLSRYLNVELVYMRHKYSFDMEGITLANSSLRVPEMSAVIGPYNPTISLVADELKVPYLVTTVPETLIRHSNQFTFTLLPSSKHVHMAVIDVIKGYKWREVAVLYDNPKGLQLIGDIMVATDNGFKIELRSWYINPDADDETLRNHLLQMRRKGQQHICVALHPTLVTKIFQMALHFSMLSHIYSWLVVTLNPYEVDFKNYSFTQVNFTTFEPLCPPPENFTILKNRSFLDNVVAYQAVKTVTEASYEYVTRQPKRKLPCRESDGVSYCSSLIKGEHITPYFYENNTEAKSGFVHFMRGTNELSQVHLSPVFLSPDGLSVIGSWMSDRPEGKRLQVPAFNESTQPTTGIIKKKYKIVTILDPPFVMYVDDYKNKTGRAKFKGFLLDMMDEIARNLAFEYHIYEVPDKSYGSQNEQGEWNGMINQLIKGEADMCLGAISITSEREQVVDFTKPFMQKNYNLLIKKPKEKNSIFQFLWPFTTEVWVLTIASILFLGILLFLMDRLSPNSNDPRFRFNMGESVWFIYGSLVGEGTELMPRTISGRILTAAWWFFALILISSYTANLAAFLTVTKIDTPIRSLSDLVQQTKIRYGTVKNTNAHTFFRTSKVELFKDMWNFMEYSDSLVNNSYDGLKKVQEGDYAFIWDTPVNKYFTMKHCDVMTVGEPFDQKGYGIGVPRGAAYRDDLTMSILTINEAGKIQKLEDQWWSNSKCSSFQDTATASSKELNFFKVAGVFLVLAIGAGLAFITSIIEFLFRKFFKEKKKTKKLTRDCELQTSLYGDNSSPTMKRQKSWMFSG